MKNKIYGIIKKVLSILLTKNSRHIINGINTVLPDRFMF